MGLDGLSLARLLANSDRPTGPTLAACGDAIARNYINNKFKSKIIAKSDPSSDIEFLFAEITVAFTAPLMAAAVELVTPTAATAAPDASIE